MVYIKMTYVYMYMDIVCGLTCDTVAVVGFCLSGVCS